MRIFWFEMGWVGFNQLKSTTLMIEQTDDRGGWEGVLPSVTEAGFDERCSFVACHWSMLIFVTAKQTDRQRTCLICVCDNIYIHIHPLLLFSQPLYTVSILRMFMSVSLTPSIAITHPSSSLYTTPLMPENHPFSHHPCSTKLEPIMPPAGQPAISLAASICTAEWVNFMFTISAQSSVHPAIHDAQLCDGNLCSRISLL